jgi:branched-chain amino acid transport system substrate-binding protein
MITRRRFMVGSATGIAFAAAAPPLRALAQQSAVKIGLLLPFTGQFAFPAAQLDRGVRLYMEERGDQVSGRKIEVIRRDTAGAPESAGRLARELIVNDQVDILAGLVTSPEALAVAALSAEAKKFTVVMNAGASIITAKSSYLTRSSFTLAQNCEPLGKWAFADGVRRVFTMVADYTPGHDAEASFQGAFKEAGGEVIGSVRMPLASQDFSAYVQRAKDANPDGIFLSVPGGSQPTALAKALIERGVSPTNLRIMSLGELTYEEPLNAMGDAAIGIITAFHYDYAHKSAANAAFVKAYNGEFDRNPDNVSVGGYDGMHVIYEALKASNGSGDAESLIAAAKGLKWESPRGMIAIDPETRDIVNTVYIRRVEKVSGILQNVEVAKLENVKDPVKARAH